MSETSVDLTGNLAVVTGAGSGIGKAVAIGLAVQGWKLALIGRSAAKLRETAAAVSAIGGKASVFTANVARADDVEAAAGQIVQQCGVPAVLVNAAGIFRAIGPILEGDPAEWIETVMINTIGPYLICRAFAGDMVKRGWGRIVNVSSAASLAEPEGTNSAYATSKVALNHFTRQLAAELAGTGVTANVFHPGEVKTDMWASIRDQVAEPGELEIWVDWVERTGGDSTDKSVRLILDLLKPESDGVNGRFLWIEDGLKNPMPSWD